MKDLIERRAVIEALKDWYDGMIISSFRGVEKVIKALPSAQPEPFDDADKLKRCRFEYINACKIVACPTPDTSKNDIYDAYAVMKALHPIFGDAEFKKTERREE